MNKIKVLIVTPDNPYPEYKDGTAKILANLLKENPKYKARLVCLGDLGEEDDSIDILKPSKYSEMGVWLKWFFSSYPINTARYKNGFNKLSKYIRKNESKYDVIHFSTPFLFPILNEFNDSLLNKIMLFPIDSVNQYNQRRIAIESNWLKKILYKYDAVKVFFYEKKYYSKVKKVCFVSDLDAKHTEKIFGLKNCYSIPNGVDVAYFKREDAITTENAIVFTGNMNYGPNEDAARFFSQKVFPYLKTRHEGLKLYLVGNAPGIMIKELASNDIIVTGFVDDLRPYLNKAKVFVSPLRYGAGVKNKILEAMSMGLPIVGTSISFEGLETDAGAVKELKDFNNVVEWEKAISHYFELDNGIGDLARNIVCKSYSWEMIRQRYGELYENSDGIR